MLYKILLLLLFSSTLQAQSLSEVLHQALSTNADLKSEVAKVKAEDSLIAAQATLEDPRIGISKMDRGMETTYFTISQNIRFPLKYYYQAQMQKEKFQAAKEELSVKEFELRSKIISKYYELFSLQKRIQLTQANMQAVREFSRVAERRYAAGTSTQSDSMKSHFELTQLELELLRLQEEEDTLQSDMKALLSDSSKADMQLSQLELVAPKFEVEPLNRGLDELKKLLEEKSPQIKAEKHRLASINKASQLAKWEFAPDFQLQYQQRIEGQPEDAEIFMVNMTFPLWFWKKGSEASAANSKAVSQEYKLRQEIDNAIAEIKSLKSKVENNLKSLTIHKTSLIPQAQGAYNSSKAAYRANKTGFLDLLDSERSLYRVKNSYYQSLTRYVRNLAQLEAVLGFLISDITRGEK